MRTNVRKMVDDFHAGKIKKGAFSDPAIHQKYKVTPPAATKFKFVVNTDKVTHIVLPTHAVENGKARKIKYLKDTGKTMNIVVPQKGSQKKKVGYTSHNAIAKYITDMGGTSDGTQ
jgi:hypothetical protein